MADTIEMCKQKLSAYGVELEDGFSTMRITARCVPGCEAFYEDEADETLDDPAHSRSFVYGWRSEDYKGGWGSYCSGLLGNLRYYGCMTRRDYVEDPRYQDKEYETWEERRPTALNSPDAEPAAADDGIAFELEEPEYQEEPGSSPKNPVMGLSFGFAAVERVVVDEDNPYFCARDGVLFNKDMTRLIWYPYGKRDVTYTVPHGVKEIGPWAFAGEAHTYPVMRKDGTVVEGRHYTKYVFNKLLRRVILPDTAEVIWDHAFDHCIFLVSVDLARVKEIQWDAFRGCKELKTLELPDSLEFLTPAFRGCDSLKAVRFLGARRQLRSWVTHSSTWRTEYLGPVPYSPPFMEYVFGQDLRDMRMTLMPKISADHPQFILEDGVLFSRDRTELIWCDPGKFGFGHFVEGRFCMRHWEPGEHSAYTVPATVVRIGDRAFERCVGLTQVTIRHPDTLIGKRAFFRCEHLKQVTFQNAGSVKRIGDSAFHCCYELEEPPLTGVKQIGDYAFFACGSLWHTVTVPESCRHLGERAFDGCNRLRALRIPKALPPHRFTWGTVKDVRSAAAIRY